MPQKFFENPILKGDYSDPDVIRVGDKYYMIASTMQLYPGMPILESTDLIHWKTINYAVPNIDELEPRMSPDIMGCYNNGIYAGAIRRLTWKEKDETGKLTERSRWFVYTTIYQRGIIVSTADDVYGTWNAVFMRDKNGLELIAPTWDDNCPYWEFNEDGTLRAAYMIASKPGGHWWNTRIFQMSLDGMRLLDGDLSFMAVPGDAARIRTGETPREDRFSDVASGDPVGGEVINRFTGEFIPTAKNIYENHVQRINALGDIESVLCAGHVPGREGTIINDTPSAEASKIIRFGEDTEIGRTYFSGRHGDHEKVADYIYIFSSEWWDGFRFPILRRAKCIYGDIFDENGKYLRPGGPGEPGCFETQRLNLNLFDPVDTREPNQGGYVDVPPCLSEDGQEHWYFLTHFGKLGDQPDYRPSSLLSVTWIEGWPMIGKLPEGDVHSTGYATVDASQYDGTGLTPDADPSRHHPHARLIPGVMEWTLEAPPIKGEHRPTRYQDSDNFGAGEFGGEQNSCSGVLSPNWQFNHAPRREWYSLTEREGFLRLYAFPTADRTEDFSKIGNVICQRYLSYDRIMAECRMDVSSMEIGQEAGLAHFNGGVSFSSIGVKRTEEGLRLSCDLRATDAEPACREIIFRTTVSRADWIARFFFSTDGGESFTELNSGYILCPGNYRGDYIGMYTYNNLASPDMVGSGGRVDIDYFRYEFE